MKICFKVFNKKILFEAPFHLKATGYSEEFICNSQSADLICSLQSCENLPELKGRMVFHSKSLNVIENDVCSCRILIDPVTKKKTAMSVFKFSDCAHIDVYIVKNEVDVLGDVYYLWSLVRPDRMFRTGSIVMLHSSYVALSDFGAVLFTAKSGVGKSTQAKLWQTYAGAEIVNGDKTIIGVSDGRVMAYGYPVAGTSGYCLNQNNPVKAIAVLSQSDSNCIVKLNEKEAMNSLLKTAFVDIWNIDDVTSVSRILKSVAENCSVYSFSCLPDKSAFNALWKEINATEEII